MLAVSGTAASQQPARAPTPVEVRLYARLLAATDSRLYNRALVDSALTSTWSPLRSAAALSVGQVGAPGGLQGAAILRSLLDDRDLRVASNAAYALGLLVDSTSVTALATALNGAPALAREAAWALGEIGAPARGAIIRGLAMQGTDDARMIQLLLAAAKLRPVPVAELRPYLAMSTKPSVQWAAAYAVARFRAPAGARDLIRLAGREYMMRGASSASVTQSNARLADAYVLDAAARQRARAEIARGLARQAAGDSLADMAFPVLARLVNDPHPHVRVNAVRSLATYEGRGATLVGAATLDRDANVRIAAAQSAGTALDSTVAAWAPLWSRDTSLAYRSSILASARRAGARLPALDSWKAHSDWHLRLAALNAAGAAADSAAVKAAARSMIRDSDGRVRASAYGLLAGNDTTPFATPVRETLSAGLTDKDFYARATILGNLARHPRAADVPAVLDAYALSLADSGNDARIAAIGYLAAAWQRDSATFSQDVLQRIAALAPSGDPLVREAADSASILARWRVVSSQPRELSWYEEKVRSYVLPALSGRSQRATIRTRHGSIVLELYGSDAPLTVWNFMNLARTGYYRGTGFHRVVPNFVAQDGDPRDDGNGGPGYAIRDEMNPRRYERGALGMALSGPDTGGSQYFITHSPQPHLDGHYTVFGRVVSGYGALDAIIQGDRILSVTVR